MNDHTGRRPAAQPAAQSARDPSPLSRRERWGEWLSKRLDIPADTVEGGFWMELRGRNTLMVHGCRRILRFTETEIGLALADDTLSVRGERLICTSFVSGVVGIEGYIKGIGFGEEGDVMSAPPDALS